jgi:DNA-binding LacI/PurR family transcriptional regulator
MDHRRATSADVAAKAGVSRTTVSFVLNDRPVAIPATTRQRVLDAARELEYHPHHSARQLRGGTSHTLGLVLRQSPEQVASDALLADTLRGVTTAARAAGFRVLIEPLAPGEGTFEDLVRSRRTDGLIVSGPRLDDGALHNLARDQFPIVLQGSLPGLGVPSVDVDNVAGATAAVDHLIALGHRRIGCITNAPLAYTSASERLDGYRRALRAARLEATDDLVVEADFDAASGHRAMAQLLARGGPLDAVFVASDVVALGAIAAIRETGRRVPDDIAIVGFDDIPIAGFIHPPLTTVRLPAFDLGASAGRALIDRIAGRTVPDRTLLSTELVVRASTGAGRPAAPSAPSPHQSRPDDGSGQSIEGGR